MERTNEPTGGPSDPPAWVERVTERMLDLATMAIAILYWRVCQLDERSSKPPQPTTSGGHQDCRCLDASR